VNPVLQKMVEAMAAELQRQAEADDGTQNFPTAGELKDGLIGFDGAIDLEKVARAGLEAIKEPDQAAVDSVIDATDIGGIQATAALDSFFAEILKEPSPAD
jgi:hypothetical protein